jgi:hypothetical protein
MFVAIVLFLFLYSALPGLATENKYTEDFTTTQYKDELKTTADWNTDAGELRLSPYAPILVGSFDRPNVHWVLGVAVSGNYAFLADQDYGLLIIDISDPANPTLLGTYDVPSYTKNVVVSGDYAFVADDHSGLYVIDIADPENPSLLGSYDTPGRCYDIAVAGDYAYVADFTAGLHVFDISDPAIPDSVGNYETPATFAAKGVKVSGDYAFVADGDGLRVIDISDPLNPALLGSYTTPNDAQKVAVSGDCAFVADGYYGLQVIDISDPTSPTFLGSWDTSDGWAYGVAVSGDYAFLADGQLGLHVIDISDPTTPTILGTYNTPGTSYGVSVSGNYAFTADGSGLKVIDFTEFVSPTLLGAYDTPGESYKVTVSGDYAFVADRTSGLQIIDISDPVTPTALGSYDTPSFSRDVAIAGDYAFVADHSSGLQVIDITDPTNPTSLGALDFPGISYGVAVSGDYAFVAADTDGLRVINITNPTAPTLTGTYDTPSYSRGVAVAGDCAFVADHVSGLQIINITNPSNPTHLGTYNTPGTALNVTISGDHAFVSDVTAGLHVIDISDPTTPTLLDTYDTPGQVLDVAVAGDYAFLADHTSGIQVIDISDPTNLALLGTCDTPSYAWGVAYSGDYAFIADYDSGLQVIRVFQRDVFSRGNVGRSLFVNASSDTILRARLATTQTDSLEWEISADGGTSWQEIFPGTTWNQISVPGTDLLWNSTLRWTAPGDDPSVTDLQIEWLVTSATIESIIDVPDDQGGWLTVSFTKSGRDFLDESSLSISSYGIWRRVDNPALISTIQSGPELVANSLPPGTWELVLNVPAVQQDTYIAAIPTTADSAASGSNHNVFVVTAHTVTPTVWYTGQPDSGYSLDNIAPAAPTGFSVAYNTGSGNQLSWDPCPDADFLYFNIYRSSDPNFVPSSSVLVHSTTGTGWTDPEYDESNVYYKITALDYVENESNPASAETATAVAEPELPDSYRLYTNVPNPFNPMTTIRYDVPAGGGAVSLRIYDVRGALVRTLVDGAQTAGRKTAVWNGRDNHERPAASGVYFYRLEAPGYEETKKMVLVQ